MLPPSTSLPTSAAFGPLPVVPVLPELSSSSPPQAAATNARTMASAMTTSHARLRGVRAVSLTFPPMAVQRGLPHWSLADCTDSVECDRRHNAVSVTGEGRNTTSHLSIVEVRDVH